MRNVLAFGGGYCLGYGAVTGQVAVALFGGAAMIVAVFLWETEK